ncbi:MAG: hypothetical protein J0M02_15260 [Planctomycetes bacterium]|nr:hypothetical protein [Planctomycetota bacterium]
MAACRLLSPGDAPACASQLTNTTDTMRHIALAIATIAALGAADYEASYLYSTPTEQDPGNEIDAHEAAAKGTWKLTGLATDGYELSLGLSGQVNAWTFDERRLEDVELYKLMVPVTLTTMATQRLAVTASLSPGMHSDMKNVSSEDFRLEGMVMGTWIQNPQLRFILGVGYSDDFGSPRPYPIAGASWQATEALKLDLIFPAFAASYVATPAVSLLASVAPSGGQWRWTYAATDGREIEVDAALKGYRGGVGVGWMVVPQGQLKILGGLETGREIELKLAEDPGTSASLDLTDAIFGQLSFSYSH